MSQIREDPEWKNADNGIDWSHHISLEGILPDDWRRQTVVSNSTTIGSACIYRCEKQKTVCSYITSASSKTRSTEIIVRVLIISNITQTIFPSLNEEFTAKKDQQTIFKCSIEEQCCLIHWWSPFPYYWLLILLLLRNWQK